MSRICVGRGIIKVPRTVTIPKARIALLKEAKGVMAELDS
jgi:hypothetical protein